jgi:drug/metabolite transporter (DMT)-like permease
MPVVTKKPNKLLIVAAFAAIYIVWGSTYVGMLIALESFPPFILSGLRFMAAGIILFAYCLLRRQQLPPAKSIVNLSFSGILMLFFGTGAVAWVEQYISSGLAAIIVASVPLWFVLLDKREWKYNFSNKWILTGLLAGFAGVLILFADKRSFDFSGNQMKIVSLFVMLFGAACWAIGSLFLKYKKVEGTTEMKASLQMIAAGALFLIVSAFHGDYAKINLSNISTNSILAILYLVFIGSLLGYMSYVWLLGVRSATLVGTYAYVNPVVAVFLGWLIASEPIVGRQVIALGVILSGVVLVTLTKKSQN